MAIIYIDDATDHAAKQKMAAAAGIAPGEFTATFTPTPIDPPAETERPILGTDGRALEACKFSICTICDHTTNRTCVGKSSTCGTSDLSTHGGSRVNNIRYRR